MVSKKHSKKKWDDSSRERKKYWETKQREMVKKKSWKNEAERRGKKRNNYRKTKTEWKGCVGGNPAEKMWQGQKNKHEKRIRHKNGRKEIKRDKKKHGKIGKE